MSLFAKRLLQRLLPSQSVRVRVRVRVLVLKELSGTPTPSLPRHLGTPPFQFVSSIHRLLSTSSIKAPSPNTHFAVVDYLVQSCGLSPDEALKASKSIHHLKSRDKPDAVLGFLREIGVSDSDIRAAVSRDAHILLSNVEKTLKPSVAKLQELGCSVEYISALIARRTRRNLLFRHNFASKVDFWVQAIGSTEFVLVLPTIDQTLLGRSLEKVLIPNLSFLKEQCGFSSRQIVRVIRSNPRLITFKPEVLKGHVERAEELGVARSSGTFVHALVLVSYLNQGTIDARLHNFKRLGLSQEEITTIVSKLPLVLSQTEEMMGRKVEFLLNEIGGDKLQLLQNPSLLSYSLGRRIIPRNIVRKLLKSKGIALGDLALTSFMRPSEEIFLVKFIVPNENAIPGLRQAYLESIAKGTSA